MPIDAFRRMILVGTALLSTGALRVSEASPSNRERPEDIRCVSGRTDDAAPNGPLTADQMARVDRLTPRQIAAIDAELLSLVDAHWRKVARLVGIAMTINWLEKPGHIAGVYCAQRVTQLVQLGKLQSQGDLRRMRFSEVRLGS